MCVSGERKCVVVAERARTIHAYFSRPQQTTARTHSCLDSLLSTNQMDNRSSQPAVKLHSLLSAAERLLVVVASGGSRRSCWGAMRVWDTVDTGPDLGGQNVLRAFKVAV